ncbi:MAG: N-acetylmuramoyl-L-alanine amidase [Proteobacteria bacterium]|nr:N-acetylmuramoyl-L-alanine amidase [Pseudomonadota bacterium]
MDRRSFLNLLGKGLLASSTISLFPSLVWGKTSFDYALEGQNLIQGGSYEKAVKALKEAVRLDPESDWAFGLLGRAYRGLGRKAEAVDAFRQAVRLNPEDVYSRMMTEIMTQKPIPKLKKTKKPLTSLEKKALEEEAQMLSWLRSEDGLRYQVKRVVIDAGHGGFDSGAVGKAGLKEKDVTLDLAKRLHQRLQRSGGIKSFLTRTGDYYVPLSERTVIANQYHADLFISIHINANKNRDARGSETYFCSERASSKEAARVAALENAVLKYDTPFKKRRGYIDIEEILFQFERKLYWSESGKFARGFQKRFGQYLPLKSRGVHSANFYVLRKAKMPSILLETGFISNPRNESMLKQDVFRERIVDAIVRGLV